MFESFKEKMIGLSVLIVEDDSNVSDMMKHYLERVTDKVFIASNGKEGYELFLKQKPEIVISDIIMPIMNGLEMCAKIRKESNTTQLIIFTGFTDKEKMINAIDAGVNHFLFKPFELKIFVATLEQSATTLLQIKELQHAKQESEQLMLAQSRQAAMGEMIVMIAHQWRQPLATVSMYVNNMLLSIELDEIDKDEFNILLHKISKSLLHLSETIDDFKDYFQPKKEKERANISQTIDKTLDIVAKSLENNNIEVRKSYTKDVELNIYHREFLQVLINIINNAKESIVESSKEHGLIEIEIKDSENYVTIMICDNGKGIEKADEPHVFEPYFSTKGKNGTGLGLYMCKTIIEKHLNGKISFEKRKNGV